MDIKRIQTAESFVLEGKLPCQQRTERGGQLGSPFLDGKAFSAEKSPFTPSRLGFPMIFMSLGSDEPSTHPLSQLCMSPVIPPDPQVHMGLSWLKVGVGWVGAGCSCPPC